MKLASERRLKFSVQQLQLSNIRDDTMKLASERRLKSGLFFEMIEIRHF